MRTLILIFIVLLLVAAPVSHAQDATLADVIASDPEMSALMATLQRTDPSILEMLTDPNEYFMLIVPTNAALTAFEANLGADFDADALTEILLYHLSYSGMAFGDLDSSLNDGGDFNLDTLQGQSWAVSRDAAGTVTIDGFPLLRTDIFAANGVIHVVDAVLQPETRPLPDVIASLTTAATPELTQFWAAVQAADPLVMQVLANPDATLTIFAPSDAAMSALAVQPDQSTLTSMLLYHMLADSFSSGDIRNNLRGRPTDAPSIEGHVLIFTQDENGQIIINNSAHLVIRNIEAANGVIHVIDTVLQPPQ